jgi:hypothetical protein
MLVATATEHIGVSRQIVIFMRLLISVDAAVHLSRLSSKFISNGDDV